jgi:hypothetical protein
MRSHHPMHGIRNRAKLRSVKLVEHFVHGVDDRLRLIQLNIVPAMLNHTMYAARRKMRQSLVMSIPLLSKVSPECSLRPIPVNRA